MLKNDYLDAKIGVDTGENEPSKVLYSYLIFIRPRDLIFTYVYRPRAPSEDQAQLAVFHGLDLKTKKNVSRRWKAEDDQLAQMK